MNTQFYAPDQQATRIGVGVAVGTLVGGVAARSTSPYDRISHH